MALLSYGIPSATMVQTRRQRRKVDGVDGPAAAKADGRESEGEGKGTNRTTSNGEKRSGGAAGDARSAGRRGKRKSAATRSEAKRSPLDTTPVNDEIAQVKTAKACARRWDALFAARDSRRTLVNNSSATNSADCRDAFDCSDLIVPPACELVNREVEKGIERWKDLASRVVEEENGPSTAAAAAATGESDEGGEEETVAPLRNPELLLDANLPGDKRKQRLMPYNFDYACKRKPSEGNAAGEDGGSGGHHCPRVISLLDPTKTIPYEEELWNVFKSVRTSEELERAHALGNIENDGGTLDDNDEVENVTHGCQHTLAVKNVVKEGLSKYSRLDAHSLGRLRIRDRHSDPLGGFAAYPSCTIDSDLHDTGADNISNHEGADDGAGRSQTTIRFEILRHSQNLQRGSGPDRNRMEVELHGSQHTLHDLHCFLVECALNGDGRAKGGQGDGDDICAGVFFIENTFYTCGEVGDRVGGAIQRWLDWMGDKEPESVEDEVEQEEEEGPVLVNEARSDASITRRQYVLGLSQRQNMIPMSEMKLEDIPLRLGVRYFHMFVPPPTPLHVRPNNLWSLANESAVFVTGVHTHNNVSLGNDASKQKQHARTKVPIIIHDTWAPPQRHFCLACNYSLASVVTVNDPLTDAAPPALDRGSDAVHLQGVPMCSSCYQALHYKPCNERGGENDQPLLELRKKHQPGLVFPIEAYQRMVTASSLDEVPKSAAFWNKI